MKKKAVPVKPHPKNTNPKNLNPEYTNSTIQKVRLTGFYNNFFYIHFELPQLLIFTRQRFIIPFLLILLLYFLPAATLDAGEDSMQSQVFTFLKNPSGLSINAAAGFSSQGTLFESGQPGTDQYLVHLKAGIQLGDSFVDIRVSPYLGGDNQTLLIQALSGINLLTAGDEEFYLLPSLEFFGMLLSGTTPTETVVQTGSLGAPAGGLGISCAGMIMNVKAVLNLGAFQVALGGYFSLYAILPFYPLFDFGILGPDIKVRITENMRIFFDCLPWKFVMNVCHYELGVEYSF